MSKTSNKFSPEVRSRAVRLVLDHGQHMRAACSMRWSRPSMIGGRSIAAGSYITATEAAKAERLDQVHRAVGGGGRRAFGGQRRRQL
jgi:hypothetical protein